MKVGLIGAGGYSGAELLRLLGKHPYCTKISLFSSSLESGHCRDFATIQPAFYGLGLKVYGLPSDTAGIVEWEEFYRAFDVVFWAIPHKASVAMTKQYRELSGDGLAKIIDLSGALRLKQPEIYFQWYGEETLSKVELEHCRYGLSELFRHDIAQAQIVANPGCYATAIILALAPLAKYGLLGQVRVDAKSGVSGAGKKATEATHFSQVNESLCLYKLHRHQHTPEIEMALADCAGQPIAPITLATHLLPITRGIMATCYIELTGGHNEEIEDLHRLYRQFYYNCPFVQIRPTEGPLAIPEIRDVSFSNRCDIGLCLNPYNNELVVVSVIDNLLKGAAGQAVQNMNLLFGFEEQCGLPMAAALP